jgi:hypothetical protein
MLIRSQDKNYGINVPRFGIQQGADGRQYIFDEDLSFIAQLAD